MDDSVDETEAVKRYNDYKLDFQRQKMQDFFLAHKDEEWYVSRGLGLLALDRGGGEAGGGAKRGLVPSGMCICSYA